MNHSHCFKAKKLLALALAGTLAAGCTIPAAAAEVIGDNVKPSYDEAYYATLDYYGNLLKGSVVKSYITNGASSLTDYGTYDEITNLTDGTPPVQDGNAATFNFSSENPPSHFYFEGTTAAPFEALPWTISVSYTLNGVPTRAEDLAGKTGVVEIIVDAVPNENASEYAKNNYTLEATAMFNQDDILSLEAPGAQVQLIGNLRVVLFATLPGETHHCVIRVGTDSFSFDGLTFLLVPATLSQLDEISKLSQRKDDLEEDYHKLSGSLDELLNSFSSLGGSLRETADGLDQLNEARDTVSQGKDQLYADGDKVLEDLKNLNVSMSTLPGHLGNADDAVTDVTDSLNDVSDSAVRLQGNLRDLDKCLKDIQKDLDNLQKHTGSTEENVKQLGEDMDQLKKLLDQTKKDLEDMDIQINGGILGGLSDKVKENIKIHGMTGAQIDAALTGSAPVQNAWIAASTTQDGHQKETINFQDFQVGVMLGTDSSLTPEKAREAVALFSAVSALNPKPIAVTHTITTILIKQGMSPIAAGLAAPVYAAKYADYQKKLPTIKQVYEVFCGSTDGQMNRQQFFAAMLMMKELKALTPQQIASGDAAKIIARKDEFLATAAKLIQLWDTVYKDYDMTPVIGLMARVSTVLEHVGSKGLAGNMSKLLKGLGDTMGSLNNTADVGRDIIKRMDTVLDKLDDLNSTINDQVPGLRDTLRDTKALVGDMITTVDDTHSFLTNVRSLAKDSGDQLDAGTKKSLESLAQTLRKTANSTDAVGGVKTAKDAVTDIVEETWNDFTGDVNNMLMMDPNAEAQSLTSSENPAPTSIQVLIRTQEIKEASADAEKPEAKAEKPLTFWGRVKKMFHDFWSTITGIFH